MYRFQVSGQPHTWNDKFPGMTPWTDDWKTRHNMMLPKQGFHPGHIDIPDDGFSLGDPLDDICYWELHWMAGRRPREEADDNATISDPGMRDNEDRDYTDAKPKYSVLKSDSDATEAQENSGRHGSLSNGVGETRSPTNPTAHNYDSDEDASCENDDEMGIDDSRPSAPFHPPLQPPKMITFELRRLNSHQKRPIKPFIVQIYPKDSPDDILSAVGSFFRGVNGSIPVAGFENDDGQAFVPQYGNLVHHETVFVLWVDAEAETLRREKERAEKELLVRRVLARAKRRKLNGGLTKIGRKRVWKKPGGLERKRVNGRFA